LEVWGSQGVVRPQFGQDHGARGRHAVACKRHVVDRAVTMYSAVEPPRPAVNGPPRSHREPGLGSFGAFLIVIWELSAGFLVEFVSVLQGSPSPHPARCLLLHHVARGGGATGSDGVVHGVATASPAGSTTVSKVRFCHSDTGISGECPGIICGEGNSKWLGGNGMPLNSRSLLWQ
jgi:hypothetical protein